MTNETKHTPGPWHHNINAKFPVYAGDAPNHTFVANVLTRNDADMRLIAAAPELLEALKLMRDIRQKHWQQSAEIAFVKGQTLLPWPEIQQADTAIAKAEGRS